MAEKRIHCPACGAQMKINTERDFAFCGRCGAKVVRRSSAAQNGTQQTAPASEKKQNKKLKIAVACMALVITALAVFLVLTITREHADSDGKGPAGSDAQTEAFADTQQTAQIPQLELTKQGDTVTFGSYPQSAVTDSGLIASLNAQQKTWTSYNYYTGTDAAWADSRWTGTDWSNGKMKTSDYMQYADITSGGQKYRGVRFTQYRPECTGAVSSAENSDQDENGYAPNTVYWFRYEPISWRVLDPDDGLLLCETVIDCQPYNNFVLKMNDECWGDAGKTYYANNYEKSSIRQWLNNDFYETAFTAAERAKIASTTLDNRALQSFESDLSWPQYDSAPTTDKIFLLSQEEAENAAYGFTDDTDRQAAGSDYAKCQGLNVGNQNTKAPGMSGMHLRTASYNSAWACGTGVRGFIYIESVSVNETNGIRPALKLER